MTDKLVFEGDALWGPCPDGGSLDFIDGEPVRSGGLSAAAYISMFGGNQLDDGTPDSALQWWGNFVEDSDEEIRGRTGTLLQSLPMTSSNLIRVEATVLLDLQWMLDLGIATELAVTASMQSARFLVLQIEINSLGNTAETYKYRLNWASGPFEPELTC
jgi:phage gp46-like protein